MSNKVWVTWKDDGVGEVLVERVKGLEDDAIVVDLREKIKEAFQLEIAPAFLGVFKTDEAGVEKKLKEDEAINDYFVPSSTSSSDAAGPGQTRDAALVVSIIRTKRPRIEYQEPTDADRENIDLRKRVLALEMQDSHAVSYANYFAEKSAQQRVRPWFPTVDTSFELPAPLRVEQLPQGSEKFVVKPFWKEILLATKLVEAFSNGYEVGHLGPKTPDVAFYPLTIDAPTATEFVGFGDCKGDGWTGTSAGEKGQVMQYSHRILDAQPQRSHVYGFVTNNHRVLLIRAVRATQQPFGVLWDISAVMTFEDGMKTFFHLLEHENGFVAPPKVLGNTLVVRYPLRPGGTCRAFAADYRARGVVAKLYMEPNTAEEDASKIGTVNKIRELKTVVPNEPRAEIPAVVAVDVPWLLVTPMGRNFTPQTFKLRHLKMLLRTLKIVHQANIIHRDVRFSNIFFLPLKDGVLLNDWGSSTSGGSLQLVQGCPEPFCHPELIQAVEAVPQVKHDLYSLVASAALLLLPGLPEEGRRLTFAKAFDAAERLDYHGIWRGFEEGGFV